MTNTSSENQNIVPSEYLTDNSPMLSRKLVNDQINTFVPQEGNTNVLQPNGLSFMSEMSNGLQSRVNGINDFTVYNDYIHYDNNMRWNIMGAVVLSSVRFELYSRQFRGY